MLLFQTVLGEGTKKILISQRSFYSLTNILLKRPISLQEETYFSLTMLLSSGITSFTISVRSFNTFPFLIEASASLQHQFQAWVTSHPFPLAAPFTPTPPQNRIPDHSFTSTTIFRLKKKKKFLFFFLTKMQS